MFGDNGHLIRAGGQCLAAMGISFVQEPSFYRKFMNAGWTWSGISLYSAFVHLSQTLLHDDYYDQPSTPSCR
jgi:hypothetical protein